MSIADFLFCKVAKKSNLFAKKVIISFLITFERLNPIESINFSCIFFSTESETLSASFRHIFTLFSPTVKTLQNPNLGRKC